MMTSMDFPVAADDDPGDVVLALQTANALWKQGDSADALRWLTRAAEAAEGEGKDDRALSLARIAADLRESAGPPSMPPPPQSRRPPSLPAPPPRVGLPPAVVKASLDDVPTPAYGVPAVTPGVPPAAAPPRPSSSTPPAAQRPSSTPAVTRPVADTRTALRVAVELLPSRSGTLMVRILGAGESLPAGATEALLVPTSPGVDLVHGRGG